MTGRSAARPRRLATYTCLASLAVIGLALPAYSAPAGPAPAQSTTAAEPIPLPGLGANSYHLTLVTGDQVTLTGTGGGRYTAVADPAPRLDGGPATVLLTDQSDGTSTTSLYAQPGDAAELIEAGVVDQGLFDLPYLAAHGYGSGRLPVVVQYAEQLSPDALAGKAKGLPGVTAAAVLPGSDAVEVTLDLTRASAFWAAITPGWQRLAAGIARVWLAGHQSQPPATRPAAGSLYTVTETITRDATPFLCNVDTGTPTTLCLASLSLRGVNGDGVARGYAPTSVTCVDPGRCSTWQARYTVPAGAYSTDGTWATFIAPDTDRSQIVWLDNPQFTVSADTEIAFDVNQAQRVVIDTPQPSETYSAVLRSYRGVANGMRFETLLFTADPNFWLTPTSEPITIGSFHLTTSWEKGKPTVTMKVGAPRPLTLHPVYPSYMTYPWAASGHGAVRFTGRQTLPVVDAGLGRAQDFAGLDVRGKLVLVQDYQTNTHILGCVIAKEELQNAIDAGAAGVLVDPIISGPTWPTGDWQCPLPLRPDWWFDAETGEGDGTPADIPYAAIPHSDATALRDLLGQGPVSISVTDGGTTPYAYQLTFTDEGRIPASEHLAVTDQQLTRLTEDYRGPQAGQEDNQVDWVAVRPNDFFTGGTGLHLPAPQRLVTYIGPAAPDSVYDRLVSVPAEAGLLRGGQTLDVFADGGGAGTEDWDAQPAAPGAPAPPTDVLDAQPNRGWADFGGYSICAFCRQANTLYPTFNLVSGANPRASQDGGLYFAPSSVYLYRDDGTEIPATLQVNGTFPTFDLAPQPSRYRLSTAYTIGDQRVLTDWNFTSAEPTADRTPPGSQCVAALIGLPDDACEPAPLPLLRYDAGTDLRNAVTAPGTHQLQVSAYYQSGATPKIANLEMWTSTDGGTTWTLLHVASHGAGDFSGTYTAPKLSDTNGTVSIKVTARDTAGNDITQTIVNAFALGNPADR